MISKLYLVDKSTLKAGDEVIYKGKKQIITAVKNGGCIGERIESATHWLGCAQLYITKDQRQKQIDELFKTVRL